jgi:predicted ABC-class ATPase
MSIDATNIAPPPQNGGLKGIAPSIFTGDRSKTETFLNEFWRYRLLNRNNESIRVPFYRVLTALSYIRGPLVDDWVNACDRELERRIDNRQPNAVDESDEALWTGFENAFKAAWKDTARTQSAYDQLMRLAMRDLDIDTYTATFERLATAAEWEPDAKGTIARYRAGLRENIHR